jgi:hypothetical protein
LASDSQTTYGATKSLDSQKINRVDFPKCEVLVAQSGSAELADKAVEIMCRKASGAKPENHESILKVVQESVREVRDSLIETNKGCGFSEDG